MPKTIDLRQYVDPTARLLGERMKCRRKEANLTQAEVADKTGMTASYISLIERGLANPTLDMMVKLAATVGTEVWDLVRPPEKIGNGAD